MAMRGLLLLLAAAVCLSFVANVAEATFVCKECEKLANDILSTVESEQTYETLTEDLENICTTVLGAKPLQDLCIDAVDGIVEALQFTGQFLGKGWSAYGLCTMLNLCDYYCCILPYRPEQVHIATTGDPTEMVVSFVTGEPITPTVEWGLTNCVGNDGVSGEVIAEDCAFNNTAVGTSKTYTQAAWEGQLHTVTLTGLKPSTVYFYRVGDPAWDWSNHNFNFTTPPDVGSSTDPGEYHVIAFGDMGATDVSDANIFELQRRAQASEIDLIIHAGDISYADGFMYTWDSYMRKVEFFSAYVPYMPVDGNHEIFYNFTAYKHRFDNPGKQSRSNTNMYFSFDYGNAHFIGYSFEKEAGIAPDMKPPNGEQYVWLQQDLEWANAPENRTARPWIIMYGHRDLYCSNTGSSMMPCYIQAALYRSYIEDLINEYGVDLVVQAHVHDYERTLPVYNGTVTNTNYDNPSAPTYVVAGTGGNREGTTGDYPADPPAWSQFYSTKLGFGHITLTANSLHWQYYDTYDGQYIDEFTITKD
mmetsp:Transcript_18328/g.70799  ORF Transcript_18328/g.70799 Transcript_18328/m.70799 type:complete len:531 (+) Transcript_18328:49-1641(+)